MLLIIHIFLYFTTSVFIGLPINLVFVLLPMSLLLKPPRLQNNLFLAWNRTNLNLKRMNSS